MIDPNLNLIAQSFNSKWTNGCAFCKSVKAWLAIYSSLPGLTQNSFCSMSCLTMCVCVCVCVCVCLWDNLWWHQSIVVVCMCVRECACVSCLFVEGPLGDVQVHQKGQGAWEDLHFTLLHMSKHPVCVCVSVSVWACVRSCVWYWYLLDTCITH